MSLPASSYTPTGGYTPQGQQTAQNMPNSTNTAAPPPSANAASFPSDQTLNNNLATANATNVNLGTANARQGYITNSNLPAMQANYDDLAKQLFNYDSGVLAPQFQGQNPGTPTDAASFGRVDASPLGLTVGAAGLPASSGTYNSNPKYALSSQVDQGNAIANLLGTLTSGMSTEFGSRVGTYKSDSQAAQNAVDTILKIMGLKQDAIDKAAARASSGGLAGENQSEAQARLIADAKKGVTFTDLIKRYTADGLSQSTIRDLYNQVNYYKKPAQESEDQVLDILGGAKQASKGTSTAGKRAEYAKAVDNIEQELNKADQNKLGLGSSLAASAQSKSNFKVGGVEVGTMMMNPQEQNLIQYQGLLDSLFTTAVATLSSRGATKPDLDSLKALKPTITMPKDLVNKKIDSINALVGKYPDKGSSAASANILMTGPGGTYNVPANKVNLFKQNGYK